MEEQPITIKVKALGSGRNELQTTISKHVRAPGDLLYGYSGSPVGQSGFRP